MNRWFRQSFPPRSFTYIFFGTILFADLLAAAVCGFNSQVLGRADAVGLSMPFLVVSTGIGSVAAGILAICRAERFPAYRKDYYDWLATTPWQASSKTPFGPWHPVLRDVLPLSLFAAIGLIHGAVMFWAMSWQAGVQDLWAHQMQGMAVFLAVAPFLVFIFMWTGKGYVAVTRQWNWSVYLPLLTLGLLIHLGLRVSAVAAIATAAILFPIATILIWRRMQTVLMGVPSMHLNSRDQPLPNRLGASLFRVLPPSCNPSIGVQWLQKYRQRTPAIALLLVVWLSLFPWRPPELMFVFFAVLLLSFSRLIAYTGCRWPHASIAARWATRRLIVAKYDRVYVPTFLMLFFGFAFPTLAVLNVISTSAGAVWGIVVPVVIGMASGPDFRQWSLTAPMKIITNPGAQRRKQPNSIFN